MKNYKVKLGKNQGRGVAVIDDFSVSISAD